MLAQYGSVLQRSLHNIPEFVSVNETGTAVVTSGGNIYFSGFKAQEVQPIFEELKLNRALVGCVVSVALTKDRIYVLNNKGQVYGANIVDRDCNLIVREVYMPSACDGDKACKIVGGYNHVVILTEDGNVYGAGSNKEYQIMPRGEEWYESAIEMIVTNVNQHNNQCCDSFQGSIVNLYNTECPWGECTKPMCLNGSQSDTLVGYMQFTVTGGATFQIPLDGNLVYSGTGCASFQGEVTGNVTYRLSNIHFSKCNNTAIYTTTTGASSNVPVFVNNDDVLISTLSDTSILEDANCGNSVTLDFTNPSVLPVVTAVVDETANSVTFTVNGVSVVVSASADVFDFTVANDPIFVIGPLIDSLPCCGLPSFDEAYENKMQQPCWRDVFAGENQSVLVDETNRMFVFGDIHKVRDNRRLLGRPCNDNYLKDACMRLKIPASEINCKERASSDNCNYDGACNFPRKTNFDEATFEFTWPRNEGGCNDTNLDPCEILRSIKACNEAPQCENTCTPCDRYIYLDTAGFGCKADTAHPCKACNNADPRPIYSITLYNKDSVCRAVSQGAYNAIPVYVDANSSVEWDINGWSIDAKCYPLYQPLELIFNDHANGATVDLYIDIDEEGGIQFTLPDGYCNVQFPIIGDNIDGGNKYIMNYGDPMTAMQTSNLDNVLLGQCGFPCKQYCSGNNFQVYNAYLQGGDRVSFYQAVAGDNIPFPVTADIPTAFRLPRRVLKVGVGKQNLSVLVGGAGCPAGIWAIGRNCNCELGIDNNFRSVLCFKEVNRCYFGNQSIVDIKSTDGATFYITDAGRVFGAGKWKCLVNSCVPKCINNLPPCDVKKVAVSNNHIIFLTEGGSLLGAGDNRLGELGLCNTNCIKCPVTIDFFYRLGQHDANEMMQCIRRPMPAGCDWKRHECDCDGKGVCDPCKSTGCSGYAVGSDRSPNCNKPVSGCAPCSLRKTCDPQPRSNAFNQAARSYVSGNSFTSNSYRPQSFINVGSNSNKSCCGSCSSGGSCTGDMPACRMPVARTSFVESCFTPSVPRPTRPRRCTIICPPKCERPVYNLASYNKCKPTRPVTNERLCATGGCWKK